MGDFWGYWNKCFPIVSPRFPLIKKIRTYERS